MENIYYNLSALAPMELSLCERRLAHIDEAARHLAKLSLGVDTLSENEVLRSAYSRFVSDAFSLFPAVLSDMPLENVPRVRSCIGDDAVNSRILLCASMVEKRRQLGSPLSLQSFFGDLHGAGGDGARIAYIRNAYSETAFREFSHVIKGPAVSYPRDFNGACEEVYYGRSTYCMLPTENSDEGTLTGFRRLAAKYELAPVISCSVSTGEAQSTKFVLYSKKPELIPPWGEMPDGSRRIFVFRLDVPDGQSVTGTVKALAAYGAKLLKIDSSPVPWDDGRYSLDISAECGEADVLALLTYLTLEIPEYTPIGIYTQLPSRGAE